MSEKREYVIKRETFDSYFGVAKLIAELPRDENFEYEVAKLIKLYEHHSKLGVYSRYCFDAYSDNFIKERLREKADTHRAIIKEWDSGRWWPVRYSPPKGSDS